MNNAFISEEAYLSHYGVSKRNGAKVGSGRYPLGSGENPKAGKTELSPREVKKQQKQAKKDAEEFARAKMYYGEGAGNRRKLIKAQVEERSKSSTYKEAFDQYLNEQDMAEHAKKAKAQRRRTDAANATKKGAKMVSKFLMDNPSLFL